MTILGLTDRQSVAGRFPNLGKLRKGVLKKSEKTGKMYPCDLDYFRFTSDDKKLEAEFKRIFGEQPRSLRVFLPFVTVEENFGTAMEEWVAGGLVHRCDGQTMSIWQTPEGKYSREQRPCPYHTGEKTRDPSARPPRLGCVQCGRLMLIIPELVQAAGQAGYVTLETHSKNDLRAIMASLINASEIQEINHNPRGLRGIEFRLWRQEIEISTPTEDGKRARRKKWMVNMAPAVKWIDVQYQLDRQAALPQLAAGDAVDEEEDAAGEEYESAENAPGEYAAPDEAIEGEYSEVGEEGDQRSAVSGQPGRGQDQPVQGGQASEKPAGNGNGTHSGRPYTPEVVKSRIAATVKASPQLAHKLPDQKMVGLLAGKMAEALGGGEAGTQGRHLAVQFLFGKKSSNDLDEAEVNAGLRWLVGARDAATGRYPIYDLSAEELRRIVAQSGVAEGQGQMF